MLQVLIVGGLSEGSGGRVSEVFSPTDGLFRPGPDLLLSSNGGGGGGVAPPPVRPRLRPGEVAAADFAGS